MNREIDIDIDAGSPADTGGILDSVWQAALELLESLPDRPQRLRMRAADVTVELDWRLVAPPLVPTPLALPLTPPAALPPPAAPPGAAGPVPVAVGPVLHYICAPSVGTFYRGSEPGAAPFTDVGATVAAGQSVAIIEVMKLMLPVEADQAGQVVEVMVCDGQSVEYGERLLSLTPAGAP